MLVPSRPAHLDADGIRRLRDADHLVAEQHLDIGHFAQALEQEIAGLELLALHDERMPRVVLEHGMIEFGDQRGARPVPEMKDRRHQPDARHVGVEAVLGEQIERRRMRGRGARIGLRAVIEVEHPHRHAAAAKQPRRTTARPARRREINTLRSSLATRTLHSSASGRTAARLSAYHMPAYRMHVACRNARGARPSRQPCFYVLERGSGVAPRAGSLTGPAVTAQNAPPTTTIKSTEKKPDKS